MPLGFGIVLLEDMFVTLIDMPLHILFRITTECVLTIGKIVLLWHGFPSIDFLCQQINIIFFELVASWWVTRVFINVMKHFIGF